MKRYADLFREACGSLNCGARLLAVSGIAATVLLFCGALLADASAGILFDYYSAVLLRDDLAAACKNCFGLFLISTVIFQYVFGPQREEGT